MAVGSVAVAAPAGRAASDPRADAVTCPTAPAVDPATEQALISQVVPPDLTGVSPTDADATTLRRALNDQLRFDLSTLYDALYADRPQRYPYLTNDAIGHRAPTTAALALAIATELGGFDEARAGTSIDFARAHAEQLLRTMACDHAANTPTGWGLDSQSAIHVRQLGLAAWLLWPRLTDDTRYRVMRAVVVEADRQVGRPIHYYGSKTGTILTPGDSGAEENAWDATVLVLASAMMPRHPHGASWMGTAVRLLLSSFSTRADSTSAAVVNGGRLTDWLAGWNMNADGTVVNHSRIHPTYMVTDAWNLEGAATLALAGMAAPRAAFRNVRVVWKALTALSFPSPPYAAPGGLIFRPDGTVYFPQGNDWGTFLMANNVYLDDAMAGLGQDAGLVAAAPLRHAQLGQQVAAQARSDDGRTYQDPSESKVIDREHWIMEYLPRSWMMRWVAANRTVAVTDANFYAGVAKVAAAPGPAPAAGAYDRPVGAVPLSAAGPLRSGLPTPAPRAATSEVGDEVVLDEQGTPSPAADLVDGSVTQAADGSLRLSATMAAADPSAATLQLTFGLNVDGQPGPEFVAQVRRRGSTASGVLMRVDDGRVLCDLVDATAQDVSVAVTVPPRCLGQLSGLTVTASTMRPDPAGTTVDTMTLPVPALPAAMTAALVRPVQVANDILWATGSQGPVLRWYYSNGQLVRDPVGLGGIVRGLGGVQLSSGSRVIVGRGTTDHLYARIAGPTGGYGTWQNWGGTVTSAPAVAQAADGTTEVYARDATGNLIRLRRTTAGPVWQRLAAGMVGAPAALRVGNAVLTAYVGTDQLVRAALCTPTGCGPWGVASGRPTREGPALVSYRGTIYAAVRGAQGRAWTVPVTIANGVPSWGTWATIPDRTTGPLVLTSGYWLWAMAIDASGAVIHVSGLHGGPWNAWSVLLTP